MAFWGLEVFFQRLLPLLALAAGFSTASFGQLAVQLLQVSPSNLAAGSTISFRIAAPAPAAPVAFQFSVAYGVRPFQILRDFHPKTQFDFTPLDEGLYRVRVMAKDPQTGRTATSTLPYFVTSRVTGAAPAVNPTNHPLVALFSVPPCDPGLVRVRYNLPGRPVSTTPSKPCIPGVSVNFYVAGLYPSTAYQMQHEIVATAGITRGPVLTFTSGAASGPFPVNTVLRAPDAATSTAEGIVLQTVLFGTGFDYPVPYATDLSGRLLWYYDGLRGSENYGAYMARPIPGGNQLLLANDSKIGEVLREIDLAGNTVRETNRTRINEQLAALGQDLMGAFHHDALRLDNGHTLAIVSGERVLPNPQPQGGSIDILADMVLDLDENLQVAWVFNSFDQLNMTRPTPLGERCRGPIDGCQELFKGTIALDYTHTNTVVYSPSDGNLILSMRNQDWILKIDYRNGAGTGRILWRLGTDGDFTLSSPDPFPWFSHQHHVNLYDTNLLTLFDNGNVRAFTKPPQLSRGQVLRIDEQSKTASLVLNQSVGSLSIAFGSSGRLANGNYYFGSGFIFGTPPSQVIEYTPAAEQNFSFSTDTFVYRAFRMRNLYTP